MRDHQLDPEMFVLSGSAPIPPNAIVGRLVVSVKAALRRAKTGRGLDKDYQPPKNTLLGRGNGSSWNFQFARSLLYQRSWGDLSGFTNLYLTQTGLLIEAPEGLEPS